MTANRVRERVEGLMSLGSAPARSAFLVIGPSLGDHPALKILAGLEERIFLDDGKHPEDVVVRLMEAGAEEVHYLGRSEEARQFEKFSRLAGVEVIPVRLSPGKWVDQLRAIFASFGIPEGSVAGGLEEIAQDLEKLRAA